MHVETAPASQEVAEAYHEWYRIHIREIAEVEGVTAVRRYAPVGDPAGRMLAVYELEGDDLMEVAGRIGEGATRRTPQPEGVFLTDPPPTVRFFELIDELDA